MILTPDKIYTLNGVKISEYLLTNHNPNRIDLPSKRVKPLLKITIHNTDDLDHVEDDPEQYTRATVNGNMNSVRPNYYVDDTGAWKILEDSWCNWTNADGSGPGNTQTISIECIMLAKGRNDLESEKSMDNCARLTAYLLDIYGLKEGDVVTHTYWLHVMSGNTSLKDTKNVDYWCTKPHPYKTCPLYIIPRWKEFKALVSKYYRQLKKLPLQPTEQGVSVKPYTVRVVCDELNVRNKPGIAADSKVVMRVYRNQAFTIVDVQKVGTVPWGRLKSGAGWISLLSKYVKKV